MATRVHSDTSIFEADVEFAPITAAVFQSAVGALAATGGIAKLKPGEYAWASGAAITLSGYTRPVKLQCAGAKIIYSGNDVAITVALNHSGGTYSPEKILSIHDLNIEGTPIGGTGILLDRAQNTLIDRCSITGFINGTGISLSADEIDCCEYNTIRNCYFKDDAIGIEVIEGASYANTRIENCDIHLPDIEEAYGLLANGNFDRSSISNTVIHMGYAQSGHVGMAFAGSVDGVHIDMPGFDFHGDETPGKIGIQFLDTADGKSCVITAPPESLNESYFLLIEDEASIRPHVVGSKDYLATLMADMVWMNVPTNAGLVETGKMGSGLSVIRSTDAAVGTGSTAGSGNGLSATIHGLGLGQIGYRIKWDKKVILLFHFIDDGADLESEWRVQLKGTPAPGVLAGRGIGISKYSGELRVDTYGTSSGQTELGFAPSSATAYGVMLINDPLQHRCYGYIDEGSGWNLVSVHFNPEQIPDEQDSGDTCFVASIYNGASGNASYLSVSNIWIGQARQ